MAAPRPGKKQFNITISEADRQRLDQLCELHGGASTSWLAVVLLRYGMRNARKAIVDDAKRNAKQFPEDEENL